MARHHPTPRFAAVIPNAAYRRTGAIRQAAGRGVTANGQLIAMRFPNRAPQSPKPCAFADLLKSVARRVVDRRVLHLIKMWLDCPAEETDDRGRKTRTTEARDKRRGIPQGSPLSPLANIYMRRFVLGWKKLGFERSLGTRLVTYADDLVILCRSTLVNAYRNPPMTYGWAGYVATGAPLQLRARCWDA
jgi:hypothetical protein